MLSHDGPNARAPRRRAAAAALAVACGLFVPEAASAQVASIPPGQEAVFAEMLAVGPDVGCAFDGAQIEATEVRGRYHCAEVATEATLTVGARAGAQSSDRFSVRVVPAHEALQAALLSRVRAREGGLEWIDAEPEPEPDSEGPLERSRAPWTSGGTLAGITFAGLWLLLLAARRRRVQGITLLAAAAAAVALARWAFLDVGFAIAWLCLPLLTLAAAAPALRNERRALGMLGALLLAAVFMRFVIAPARPANWYVDLEGPLAASDVLLRRPGGYAGFFRLLSLGLPISGDTVFHVHRAAAALTVPILALAVHRAGRWPRGTAWLLGAACLIDPTLSAVGGSDAAHSVGMLAAAVSALAYVEASRDGDVRTPLIVAALAASLAGLTRPDLALAPLLGFAIAVPRRDRWPSALAVCGGIGVALCAWLGRDLGVMTRAPDFGRLMAWAGSVVAPLHGAMPALGLREGLADTSLVVGGFALALVVHAAARRDARSLAPFVILVALAAPRLWTDFYRDPIGTHVAASRYVLPTLVLWWLVASAGAAALIERARAMPRSRTPLRLALVGFLAALATAALVPVLGATPGGPELSYQRELRVLRGALDRVPEGSVIATHFVEHLPSRQIDPDLDLALPHPVLAFARPDLEFRRLDVGEPPPRCARCFYFPSSTCGLDPDDVARRVDPRDARLAAQIGQGCDRATGSVTEWVARAPAAPHFFFRLRPDSWIGLGRTDSGP